MEDLDLASAFGRSLPKVADAIAAAGGTSAGPSYGRYHRYGPDVVDVEIGFPVGAAPAGFSPLRSVAPGEVGASELPGGRMARTLHVGSYDGLAGVYDALHEWIHAQPGVDDGAGPWESYLEMPDGGDASRARTEIIWPLVDE